MARVVHQADLPRRLREAFKRIRILESRTAKLTGGGSSGEIRFNDENDSPPTRWLYLLTNDSTDLDGTFGQIFRDESGDGIKLHAVDGGDSVSVAITPTQFSISTGVAGAFVSDTEIRLTILGSQVKVDAGGVSAVLAAGKTFTLFASDGVTPILQMTDGDPDLHIPTGGAVVADL